MSKERDKFLTEAMGQCWHNMWENDAAPDLYEALKLLVDTNDNGG